MGKFRSKLKGGAKGKRWPKGQSSSSNPETKKYRNLAKSRFFQENLGPSNLTSNALKKHDAIQEVSYSKRKRETEDDADMESSMASSYQTITSFASEWSHCTNMSYNRFLHVFQSNSALHKEMLAILAAITEVIKENGGTETPTEYFCSLLTTLEQIISSEDKNEDQVTAVLSLLNMGIKTVPEGVLRSKFDDVSKKVLHVLTEYSSSDNNVIVKSSIGILTALLSAQELAVWNLSTTRTIFYAILNPFCIHSKPKWRKGAQQSVSQLVRSECFKENTTNVAAEKVAEFCKDILDGCLGAKGGKSLNVKANQTTILHVLGLMKETISAFPKAQLKKCGETILALMTLNYPLVSSLGLQVFYALFSHQTAVVPAKLNAQLISALYEYQPALTDTQSTVAWLTVMQQAHIHLADVDLAMACVALPKIFVTLTQLWLTDKMDITSAVTHSLERLLRDAIATACDTTENMERHTLQVAKCFKTVESGLGYQFHTVWQQVLHVIGVMFEVGGKNCSDLFKDCLKSLAELRDSYKFSYNNELEHVVGAAVRSLGPDFVLSIISIQKSNQEFNMDRSWLLPVLKENVRGSTLEYWWKSILPLTIYCQKRFQQLQTTNDGIGAHSHELLYLQLWNLLPSFCNKPTDINSSFKNVAKTLGTAISDHKDLRLAVMASLRKLIAHAKETESAEDVAELARFDKNFLPILFNVYTTKPSGTDEEGHRLAALDTIKIYLTIAKPELTQQLFEHALERLESGDVTKDRPKESFGKESILDLIRCLVPYQKTESINDLYQKCIKTLPDMKNSKEQKKAYRLLEEICGSDAECCKEFVKANKRFVQKLLMKALDSAAVSSKGARLRCLGYLVKAQPQLTHESVLLRSIVPEAVICCKDANEKCRLAAYDLLNAIGDTLAGHDQLEEFLTMVVAGLAGTPQIMGATVLALASILHQFSGALGNKNIQFIMENVSKLIQMPAREVVDSCLSFIKTYCNSLPTPIVGSSLPTIMKALTDMSEDCKRHFRLKVRDILDRLVRKYGSDSITPHIPATDAIMQKRVRNLRKLNARKKRRDVGNNDEEHGDDEFAIKGKPKSIDDILADSDSEDNIETDARKPNKKQSKTWIQEDADTIVDFTDPKMTNKITAMKPIMDKMVPHVEKKHKDRGFKVASDGRLIIKDDSSDSDLDKPISKLKLDKSDSEDADDDAEEKTLVSSKKRKRTETASVKSAGSRPPLMKYQAGGSGIHRAISTSSKLGSEYKAKKASGDVKKKGKADPYAYVPLKRSLLNKRKKAKISGQFKNIGRAAKKGAQRGAKAKRNRQQK